MGHNGILIKPALGTGCAKATAPQFLPYRIKGETVEILGVIHGARRWPEDRCQRVDRPLNGLGAMKQINFKDRWYKPNTQTQG